MKRMKKKVVAMVTLAMFVMTLLPMAAFADGAGRPDTDRSQIETAIKNVEVDPGEAVDVSISLRNANGETITDSEGTVVAWVENEANDVVSDVVFDTNQTLNLDNGKAWYGNVDCTGLKTITLKKAGKYTIHAGVLNGEEVQAPATNVYDKKNVDEFSATENYNTIVVTPFDQGSMTFKNTSNGNGNLPVDNKVVTLDNMGAFKFNNTDTYTVTGTLLDENNKTMSGVEVALSSNKDALKLTDDVVTTKKDGTFAIEFKMSEKTNASVTIDAGDLEYTLKVMAGESTAENIKTIEENGYVQATNDSKWEDNRFFNDAVQFEITDKNGTVLEGQDAIATESAAQSAAQGRNIDITDKPDNSTLQASDLLLVWNDGAYTLKLDGTSASVKGSKKLVPGEYTVVVALDSDKYATASFKVAKFGDVENVVVNTYAGDSSHNNKFEVEKEIALGDQLYVEAKYVDANGLEIPAKDVQIGVDGKAVLGADYGGWYKLYANTVANESLIGTVIKVRAFDDNEKKLVEKELTVVDAYDTYSLAFDATEGEINKDNTVGVSVVDADKNIAKKVSGKVYAYVAKQSNADAKVTVDTDAVANKGEFDINVYSNKATTADIVVAVKADNGAIYAGTLSYTFGEEDIPAGTSVVMTIGSTEMIINNEVVDMKDAAPFIKDNRTFVPFRALGEALGADVEYVEADKTVTYELGSTKIVMTLGDKKITVNGAEKTMDVAPFAKDGRTYVPVRFVGEGLGFDVTGLTDAQGHYVAVAFTK